MTTGSEVRQQVLLPEDVSMEEEGGWDLKRERWRWCSGGFGWGFDLADGASLTTKGSGAEQRYEENGKECRRRRKDVSWSLGGG